MSSSDTIETSASTIDQAIGQALAQLGAEQDDVTIEVLSTPRSGVLGLGARPARVRVTRRAPSGARSGVTSPPPAPPLRATPPEMRRPEARPAPSRETAQAAPQRETGEAARDERREAEPPRRPERSEEPRQERSESSRQERSDPQRTERSEVQGRERGEPAREHGARPRQERDDRNGREVREDDGSADDRRSNERGDDAPRQRRSRGGRGRRGGRSSGSATPNAAGSMAAPSSNAPGVGPAAGRDSGGRQPAEGQPPRPPEPYNRDVARDDDRDPFALVDEAGNDSRKIADLQEQAREARIFLERILELMGEQATIEQAESDDPETLELNIKGDGSGILIGRHGQTLDAIEYMVNRLLARKVKDAAPISIDTESYRARRRRLLQRMALSKGEQAKREHVAVTLDPMPPRDRRIVHLALKDDPMIATRSTGDGFMRAIEIVPVDERRDPSERGSENRGRGRGRTREPDRDQPGLGEQGGFKHGQKRIV